MSFHLSRLWGLVALPVFLAAALAVGPDPVSNRTTQPAVSQPVKKEPWISNPPAQWPQIYLSYDLLLKDKRSMTGASAGLVQLPDGRIVAATARHLLGEAGGFDPPLKLAEVNKLLTRWTLRPRVGSTAPIVLGKVLTKPDTDPELDCVAISVVTDPQRLPATVLKFRKDPLKPGDKVYLLGVPYDEPKSRQNVYPGTVVNVQGNCVDFNLATGLATRGFSGAPVIDENGYFAGIYIAKYNKSKTSNNQYTDLIMVSAQAFANSIIPK